jgi:bifunctional UDP-N-acetylglucosamine pyrophosphorylase/glucosamine-1-phosphate N-acetyltransferase
VAPSSKARSLAAVVLAAGKGKRLKSGTPKVLHPVVGRPLLWHATQNALAAKPSRLVFVLGDGADRVEQEVGSWGLEPAPVFVRQDAPLGTGHAVLAAEKAVGKAEDVLVVGGDFDPVAPGDVRALLRTHRRTGSAASILTADVDDPGGYARIVRDGTRLIEIVEGTDAPPELLERHEVSALVFAFRREDLYKALPLVGRENRQREYYLNAVIPILIDKGERVSAVRVDTGGMMGPNSRADLARLGALLRRRILERHLADGVSIADPASTYVDAGVRIGADTAILPNTFLEGATSIGSGATIGPSARIVDSSVGDGAQVQFSVVEQARIGARASVGPFAHLRRDAVLEDDSVVGNFVEVKDSTLGPGAKAKHLTYIGNARIGRRANLGAGTVTVNYDGYRKYETVVEEEAKVGSDTMLVAPVRVGRGAQTGAGSVITKDVPAGALAVERSEQRIIEGYRERKEAEQAARAGEGERTARRSAKIPGSKGSKSSGKTSTKPGKASEGAPSEASNGSNASKGPKRSKGKASHGGAR